MSAKKKKCILMRMYNSTLFILRYIIYNCSRVFAINTTRITHNALNSKRKVKRKITKFNSRAKLFHNIFKISNKLK